MIQLSKSINTIYHINRIKDSKHTISSLDAKKKKWNPISIHVKIPRDNGDTRYISQHNKADIQESHSQHHSKWRKTQSISNKIRNKTKMSNLSTMFNIEDQVLAGTVRQVKETRGYKNKNV